MPFSILRLSRARSFCSCTCAYAGRRAWRKRVVGNGIWQPTLWSRRFSWETRRDGMRPASTVQAFSTANRWPTIYALSSAAGRAAIAIIRISGPACSKIYNSLCLNTRLPKPRFAALRSIHEPSPSSSSGALLDSNALVLFFPSPNTVTGEDILELHVHGGPAIVKAVLAAIGKCSTAEMPVRYAEPGEFTRRAFLNDRLDLTQVEALGATLSAVTEEQRRIAVQGTVSGLAARYEAWRQLLLAARGELEALIDFSEDQHFDESPTALAASVAAQVESLQQKIHNHCTNSMRGELLRNGISLSFLGAPNVGKSSLLNLIIGRNAAIVSHEAGTTRDVVEVGLDLGGFFCRLGDTAGLRNTGAAADIDADADADASGLQASHSSSSDRVGAIEQEGMRRAKARAVEADVVIVVLAIEPARAPGDAPQLQLDSEVLATAAQLSEHGKQVVVVVNKMDLLGASQSAMRPALVRSILQQLPALAARDIYWTSCKADHVLDDGRSTISGMRELTDGLVARFRTMTAAAIGDDNDPDSDGGGARDALMWQEALGATERQRALLEACQRQLQAFLEVARGSDGTETHGWNVMSGTADANPEMDVEEDIDIVAAAECLREAADCLARLTGRGEAGDVEEVLGVVFERFCVGK